MKNNGTSTLSIRMKIPFLFAFVLSSHVYSLAFIKKLITTQALHHPTHNTASAKASTTLPNKRTEIFIFICLLAEKVSEIYGNLLSLSEYKFQQTNGVKKVKVKQIFIKTSIYHSFRHRKACA